MYSLDRLLVVVDMADGKRLAAAAGSICCFPSDFDRDTPPVSVTFRRLFSFATDEAPLDRTWAGAS